MHCKVRQVICSQFDIEVCKLAVSEQVCKFGRKKKWEIFLKKTFFFQNDLMLDFILVFK